MQTFIQTYLPKNYSEVLRRFVTLDGEPAELIRYQPNTAKTVQFGSAHLSAIAAEDGRLKGFYWLAPEWTDGQLPDKKEAENIATAFLKTYAPDLCEDKEIHWIKPHDETLTVNGKDITITGMKVKMRNPKDGRWFWVIIGKNHRPIIFERDIVWISFPGKRQTEKWLHDAWLQKNNKF